VSNQRYLQVSGHPDLVRDTATGAIVKKENDEERTAFRRKREKAIASEQRIARLEKSVDEISDRLNTITTLLEKIAQK